MPWESPEGSGEEESDFTFLSKLASSLPDDSSGDEDQEAGEDPRYAWSKHFMKALLDSEDSEDNEVPEDDEAQAIYEDQEKKNQRCY